MLTGEVCERLATLSPVRKQLEMSSNGSETGTKLLVQAYLSLSEAQYRSHNHCLQPPPNGLRRVYFILFYFIYLFYVTLFSRNTAALSAQRGSYPGK